MAAIDPEPGDDIITTSITDMGGVAPILYQGAIPTFADVDPVTLNVTPEAVAARITPCTKAVIATHLFGNPGDVIGIKAVADQRGIPVVEDCAQVFSRPRTAGSSARSAPSVPSACNKAGT